MNTSRFMIAALLVASSFGISEPRQAQAQYGWGYNASYYGPAYPRRVRYRYTARYAPRYGARYGYGAPMNWGANYGPVASPILPESYLRPSSYTSYYGAAYYGGGFVSSGCGCNPCGSACSPCGSGCSSGNCATGNCASGNCSTTSGASYSPEPVTNADHSTQEVTPTFKPATSDETPVSDPNDDFVGVNRRENDNGTSSEFVAPAAHEPPVSSTIPKSSSTIPGGNSEGSASTIPDNTEEVVPEIGGAGAATVAPVNREVAPVESGSTIPDKSKSTIPENEKTTIPESKPFPVDSSSPTFRTPLKPAPSEPTTEEEVVPELLPETSVKPLLVEPVPVATLVVERKRVVMQAGYRMSALSRIDVPTQRILEAGSSKLAVR